MPKPLSNPIHVGQSHRIEIHILNVAFDGSAFGDFSLATNRDQVAMEFRPRFYFHISQHGNYGLTHLALDLDVAPDDHHGVAHFAQDPGRTADDHHGFNRFTGLEHHILAPYHQRCAVDAALASFLVKL